ncbi:hypothetical protein D9613_010179 [Agrocybe pediades]|uniref:Hexosyltransferase n=1 Tax=Agrocybe pediades TaxID=84607 RepID=A0A8H4QX54_9AGAR|nr:hypothetical protein D9613_010179 [Agrocybe pediades]
MFGTSSRATQPPEAFPLIDRTGGPDEEQGMQQGRAIRPHRLIRLKVKRLCSTSAPVRHAAYLVLSVGSISISIFLFTFIMSKLGYYDFDFHGARPQYLDTPLPRPVVIRLAIISRSDEFSRRQLLRETMLSGLPSDYVKVEHRFFTGEVPNGITEDTGIRDLLDREIRQHDDLQILDGIEETWKRVSEKRFAALKWQTASLPPSEYDYSMTLDSDSFCRFRTLSQRLVHIYSDMDPRTEPVLVGNMGRQKIYWQNTVSNTNEINSTTEPREDEWIVGPRYPYPVGIGYMLSSYLASAIANMDPSIPHHIFYPYDDVMIGSWVAGLKEFHDPSNIFTKPAPEEGQGEMHRVTPRPYLPYPIDAKVVDDQAGWHDFKNRGAVSRQKSIGWDTACVHRIKADEVQKLRGMEEVKTEWNETGKKEREH